MVCAREGQAVKIRRKSKNTGREGGLVKALDGKLSETGRSQACRDLGGSTAGSRDKKCRGPDVKMCLVC